MIHRSAQIAQTAVIAAPFRPLLDGRQLAADADTVVEAGAWIGQYTTVGQGVMISRGAILEDFVAVQPGAMIGSRVLVLGRSRIGIGATIGADSVIKGYIGDDSWIGAGCRIAGDLIHRQLDPSIPWDDPTGEESAPFVDDGAFIGWRALIVGGVNIGKRAYVCAGALITQDVPDGYIAYGRNRHIHPDDWPGQLGKSAFFENSPASRPPRRRSMRRHSQPGPDRRWADVADPGPVGQRRGHRLRGLALAGQADRRYKRPPAP
jgi:serine acetyltransferase